MLVINMMLLLKSTITAFSVNTIVDNLDNDDVYSWENVDRSNTVHTFAR